MMTDVAVHALIALFLPALSFLVLAIVAPFRRLGRPAAWFSILCAAGSFAAAVIAWNHAGDEATRVVNVTLHFAGEPPPEKKRAFP